MSYRTHFLITVPNRRRLGRANVVFVHSNTVLAGSREMGEGAVWEGIVWGVVLE
jgi:hypothetical protein